MSNTMSFFLGRRGIVIGFALLVLVSLSLFAGHDTVRQSYNSQMVSKGLMKPETPLFIGFGRNYPLVRQTIVSYIAAGWPANNIFLVDNTGTMDSNELGLLSRDNPFYIDVAHINKLGASVIRTPTLLTFAQLQNFYLSTALANGYPGYWWSHQDVAVLTDETVKPYKSFYDGVKQCHTKAKANGDAAIFYAYDWLTWMDVQSLKNVGGWDTSIPFYKTDCDLYGLYAMIEPKQNILDCNAGMVFDVASYFDDPEKTFYLKERGTVPINGGRYRDLRNGLEDLAAFKRDKGRNTWQGRQTGGQNDPFWRKSTAFQYAWEETNQLGLRMYERKWNSSDCGADKRGLKLNNRYETIDDRWVKMAKAGRTAIPLTYDQVMDLKD
jgi:hypothetical protein